MARSAFRLVLHREAFAATAGRVHVRIQPLEGLLEAFLHVVEGRAVEEFQAFRVHHELRVVRLEGMIAGVHVVGVVVGVAESRAAHVLHAHAQAQALAAAGKLLADLLRRVLSEFYLHIQPLVSRFAIRHQLAAIAVMPFSRATAAASDRRKLSTCCRVFPAPSEKRTAESASSGSTPIASSVAEGSGLALEQAAPGATS